MRWAASPYPCVVAQARARCRASFSFRYRHTFPPHRRAPTPWAVGAAMAAASAAEHLPKFTCAVCLNVLADPCSLSCGHSFDRYCIARSLAVKQECPTCRAPQESKNPPEVRAVFARFGGGLAKFLASGFVSLTVVCTGRCPASRRAGAALPRGDRQARQTAGGRARGGARAPRRRGRCAF